ncbi:hypothetical protein [Salinisphaera aquimarina]|uniref:Uncharacterized protein n=1 Tax=Salinisphaera aquimarina TaxID=2094031 RepID=A0ABV7ERA3_9GAMM
MAEALCGMSGQPNGACPHEDDTDAIAGYGLSTMATRTFLFSSIPLTAIATAGGVAHLLELPDKLDLSAEGYLTVQHIYRGRALLGVLLCSASVAEISRQRLVAPWL